MTATQLSRHIAFPLGAASGSQPKQGKDLDVLGFVLWELSVYGLVTCMSPKARRSRLYGCTLDGVQCRKALAAELGEKIAEYVEPSIDWERYAWVCYSHRSTIIKVSSRPLYPSALRKRAWREYPQIKMSANNVRDAIPLLREQGLIEPVRERKRVHPLYRLTSFGRECRELLMEAEFSGLRDKSVQE
jgi:hypothetical protein